MADNYLERQYEEYEERKTAWERKKKLMVRKKTIETPPKSGK